MGIGVTLEYYDQMFMTSAIPPIVVNDVPDSGAEKAQLKQNLYTKINTDVLSNVPSCKCLKYSSFADLGVICEVCNSPVVHSVDPELAPAVWVRAPAGIAAIISPVVWVVLNESFSKGKFSAIRWLCDPRYRPDVRYPEWMVYVEQLGHPRSYNYFVNNLQRIVDDLIRCYKFLKPEEELHLRQFLSIYEDRLCSQYLPLINKTLLILEVNNSGAFMDLILTQAVDAVQTMVGIDRDGSDFSIKDKEVRVVRTIDKLADFYLSYIKSSVSPKEGLARKHIYGTRVNFSWRSVITSITEPHDTDELHIPWSVGVLVLSLHLANKLLARGFTADEIDAYLTKHINIYDPLLDQLFQELIAETDNSEVYIHDPDRKGIMATLLRNPSLQLGSNILERITRVKTNVNDPTTSISINVTRGLNADFDGLTTLPSLNFSN